MVTLIDGDPNVPQKVRKIIPVVIQTGTIKLDQADLGKIFGRSLPETPDSDIGDGDRVPKDGYLPDVSNDQGGRS